MALSSPLAAPTGELQQQPNIQLPSASRGVLDIDFSWRKFRALVTEEGGSQPGPVYYVDCNMLKPHLEFKSVSKGGVFGTANLHVVSINADCTVSGQPITLHAMKRFKTNYSHLSHAFSDSAEPVRMTWTTNIDFKVWEFICLDHLQNPVAKMSANIWAVKKLGKIEFLGPKALSDAARQEIVVMGFTLYYLMLFRMNNIFALFGAIFHRPGHEKVNESGEVAMQGLNKDKRV